MSAITEYTENRSVLIPDYFYEWDSESRALHLKYMQLVAALNAVEKAGGRDTKLQSLVLQLSGTVERNRSMRERVLDVFANFHILPQAYGFNPWPYVLSEVGGYIYRPGKV